VKLPENQIRQLCVKTREIFLSEASLVELSAPVVICGDIHGQYDDLLRHFDQVGYPPAANFLFLGDYVDRWVKLTPIVKNEREREREGGRERFKLKFYPV
jgi:hypothetical protein